MLGKFRRLSKVIIANESRLPSSAGRFFFTYAARVLAATLLTEYECQLKTPVAPNFEMGESSVPSGKVVLLIKKRTGEKVGV